MANMGIGKIGAVDTCFKHKNRWLFSLPEISSEDGVNALPPSSSARPNLSFKEQSVEHTSETIWYPVKPEFKPINIKLYDIVRNKNVVFEWIKEIYNPQTGQWRMGQYPASQSNASIFGIKRTADLTLYDGCGNEIESWIFENAYPSEINFGELDYADAAILTVDLTLRYDRAYVVESGYTGSGSGSDDGMWPGEGESGGIGWGSGSNGSGGTIDWGGGMSGGSISYIIRRRRRRQRFYRSV